MISESKGEKKEYHKGIKEQIFSVMQAGVEMKTAEIVARVDGARQRVLSELQALVASDQIEKVRRGVYLKKDEPDDDLLVIIFY